MQILHRHGAQPYRFCFSIISNQPYKKTVCSLNLPFYSSQPMLPVTPLIFGNSSHFIETPVPIARIFAIFMLCLIVLHLSLVNKWW